MKARCTRCGQIRPVAHGQEKGRGVVMARDLRPFDPAPWADRARCIGSDPGLFFSTKWEEGRKAKHICDGCPVRDECAEYALDNNIDYGVWGGLTRRERKRIRKARREGKAA